MSFFDKSFLQKAKDIATKGVGGIFNDEARENLPLATSMNNPDGTVNTDKMAQAQQQGRDALAKAGSMSMFGRKIIAPDVLAGYQKMSEDAFQRQNIMMEMMNEHQKAKLAAADPTAPTTENATHPAHDGTH